MRSPADDVYTLDEIAAAAQVSPTRLQQAIRAGGVSVTGKHVTGPDAVALVRALRRGVAASPRRALPINLAPEPKRKQAGPLAISAIAHVIFFLLMMVAASLGLLQAQDTDEEIPEQTTTRLVYLIQPGPGGGGGGGGLKMPAPPPKAERKAPAKKKVASPVPPPARKPAPPPPKPPPPRPTLPAPQPPVIVPPAPVIPKPAPTPPPPPPQAVVAPVASIAADTNDRIGVPHDTPNTSSSQGPGAGGGIGAGKGAGIGEGDGGGIGPGSGGGTGGGPFRPGSGVSPPQLVREIRANYTDDARRRGVEGDVVLEIVVRRDGSVGNVRVLQSLGSGLEQKAIDAVKQWRFTPATRLGANVDVVVEVAVGFKLR